MSRKQLAALFICSFVPMFVGPAVLSLLPIYAISLGAGEAVIGLFIGCAYVTLTIATLLSGWLSNRFQKRKLTLLLAGVVCIPTTFLMGQTNSIVLLAIFMMMLWFTGGVIMTTVAILTGIYADPQARGRTFGIIGAAGGLGQILVGLTVGAIVDNWGFPALFAVLALVWMIQIVAVLLISDPAKTHIQKDERETASVPLPKAIWLLMGAHLLTVIVSNSADLGRPLIMNGLGFDARAITSVFAVTGLIGLSLPIILGWLSDRLKRTHLLAVAYLVVSLGAIILASATSLWHFWLATILMTTALASNGVGLALVNDLATPETQATATARFSAAPWIAGAIGYGATGFLIQGLGLQRTYLTVMALPLISVLLIYLIERSNQPKLAQSGSNVEG